MQFFGQCMYSDSGSSLRSARIASVTIPKLSVNRQVNSSLWESESSSDSVDIVGEYSWVVLEQNPVQYTLPASLVHRQSSRSAQM